MQELETLDLRVGKHILENQCPQKCFYCSPTELWGQYDPLSKWILHPMITLKNRNDPKLFNCSVCIYIYLYSSVFSSAYYSLLPLSAQRINTSPMVSPTAQNVIPPSASFQVGLVRCSFWDSLKVGSVFWIYAWLNLNHKLCFISQTEEQALQRALEMSLAESARASQPTLRYFWPLLP